ncbi:MAG TPA: S-layer homology domain-containing protein, partial [Candidatus Peribacteraceae bacterium]|nr:S-layer homology domain-containing protein [Candidatus Peribacteraceae bacterium]
MRTLTWTLTTLLLLQPLLTHASLFPDVSDNHPYKEEIERLAGVQVIGGNPNGTFTPDVPVNRAAMLKMLYKASGRTPDPANVDCFDDVVKGSWYEAFVCDAEVNRFVQGYSDGSFKPNNSVNRAEAIKMTMLVLGITVPELTNINRDVLKYVDISTSAWYTKYLSAAFTKGILPISGQTG